MLDNIPFAFVAVLNMIIRTSHLLHHSLQVSVKVWTHLQELMDAGIACDNVKHLKQFDLSVTSMTNVWNIWRYFMQIKHEVTKRVVQEEDSGSAVSHLCDRPVIVW